MGEYLVVEVVEVVPVSPRVVQEVQEVEGKLEFILGNFYIIFIYA
jgi:hypothetical protein